MKKIALMLMIAFLSFNTFATAQFPDYIKIDGKSYEMNTNPLNYYFTKENPHPKDFGKYRCSACWRGYVAYWELKDNFLYLTEVREGDNKGQNVLNKIFKETKAPVKATWFTGTVTIPQGKMLKYVHMGYQSKHEKELKIQFKKGKLIKKWTIKNKPEDTQTKPIYSNAKIKDIKIEYNVKRNNMAGILVNYIISPPSNKIVDKMGLSLIIQTKDGKKAPVSGDQYVLWTKNKDTGINKWIDLHHSNEVKGSLFFPWTVLSLPKGKHELVGIVQLKDFSKVISSKKFDFWYKSNGLPPKAEAKIEKIWATQNETYKGKKGFFVHIKFKTKFMHVRNSVRIRVYLTDKEGKDLSPAPYEYDLSKNRFGTQKWINPRYINSVYKDLKLFFSYKALPLREGTHDLIAHIEIYDASKNNRESFATKDYNFQLEVPKRLNVSEDK